MLNTAIIGITGYGQEHLRLLLHGHNKGLLRPRAAVVINPDECRDNVRFLSSLGCRVYDSVEAMWELESGAIDLTMIPSSISTHYPFAKTALEQGSHVFVEKPICGTVEEAKRLVDHAASLKREVCVGFQDIYSPQVIEMKRRIQSGDFGKIRRVKGWGSWPRANSYFARNNWAGQLKSGDSWVLDSPVNNAMAHFLFLMLYWGGPNEESFAEPESLECDLFRAQNITSFDTASLRLQVADGPEFFYGVTHSGDRTEQPLLRVEGETGWFEWNHCGHFRISTRDDEETMPCMDLGTIRENMIEQICNWTCHQKGNVVLAKHALIHTKIVNALHDAGPIRDFPSDRVIDKRVDGDGFIHVNGLVDELQKAFTRCSLLSEISPWLRGVRSEPFDLRNYAVFAGGYSETSLPVA